MKKPISLIIFCFLVALVTCSVVSAEEGTWDTTTIDPDPESGSENDIEVDDDGNPHISYSYSYNGGSQSGLKYAYNDGSGWQTEVVDTETGSYNAISTFNNQPYIVYVNKDESDDNNYVYYAYKQGQAWILEKVPGTLNAGGPLDLIMDGNGYPHVAFGISDDSTYLAYAYQDSSGWHVDPLIDGPITGYISIDLGSNQKPHIGYQSSVGGMIKYATKNPTTWHTEEVINGAYQSMKLDSFNYPHFSYITNVGEIIPVLKYTYKTASGWITETVDSESTQSVGWYTSIAMFNNLPHISYLSEDNTDAYSLKYAYNDGISWNIIFLGPAGDGRTAIALDSYGDPHISYQGSLNYAHFQSPRSPVINPTNAATITKQLMSGTIGMQNTGMSLCLVVTALLFIFSGILIPKGSEFF
jgi:hypothetical protein